MVADIDAAERHVHVCFYIWLADTNGLKVVEALKRAAARGVTCRAMADDLGTRAMVRSEHWRDMAAAGVRLAVALPIGFPLSRPLKGRIDMRNHRKIVVIDNRITYCGSQQLRRRRLRDQAEVRPLGRRDDPLRGPDRAAEPARLRHRLDGATSRRTSAPLFDEPLEIGEGFPAQVIATGATVRYSAMPEMFESADVRRPARAGHHHALLRPGRADPGRALRQRPPRRRHDHRLPGEERQLDRGRGQPQLLRRSCSTPA